MSKINASKGTPSKDTGAKNNNSDNDVDYKNSAEIGIPNPSIATPQIPNEMPPLPFGLGSGQNNRG